MKRLLHTFSVMAFVAAFSVAGWTASSQWTGPGTDFNTASNWNAGLPTDNAVFSNLGPQTISFSTTTVLPNGMTFNAPGAAYTFTIPATVAVNLKGTGITDNAGALEKFTIVSNGLLNVQAGVAGGPVWVDAHDTGTALFASGSASGAVLKVTVDNNGAASFMNYVTGRAEVDNYQSGFIYFTNTVADGATINNLGAGTLIFTGTSTATNAVISSPDSRSSIQFFQVTTPGIAIGALNTAGSVNIGSRSLMLGTNGSDSQISGGIIGTGGSLVKVGTGTLVLQGANTYSAGTSVNGGILIGNTTSLQGAIGNNQEVDFVQDFTGRYTGVMTGNGTLVKAGPGIVGFAGVNTFSGNTYVNAGILNVETASVLQGTITVNSGGIFAGAGSIGKIVNNGIVRAGELYNDPMPASDYSGSGTLRLFSTGPASNSLRVTGNATLTGGTLELIPFHYQAGQLNVVHAATITGTFASFQAPAAAFFNYALQYTPTDAFVVVSSASFTSPARNENQRVVGSELDAIRLSPSGALATTIYPALYQLSSADGAEALQRMSGVSLTPFEDVAFHQLRNFAQQLYEREVPMSSAASSSLTDAGGDKDVRALGGKTFTTTRQALWARGLGYANHRQADDALDSPGFGESAGGFQVGYDHELGDLAIVGASLGYTHINVSIDDGSAGHVKALDLGLYGHYEPGPWFLNTSLLYAHDSTDATREIIFPGINETAGANFSNNAFSFEFGGGYATEAWTDTALEPSLSFRDTFLSQSAFVESGATGLNLNVGDVSVNSFVSTLGVSLRRLFKAESRHPFQLGVRTGWAHDFGTTKRELTVSFADGPSSPFPIEGTPQPRDSIELGLNGRVALSERFQLYATYNSAWATREIANEILGGLRWKW